MASKQRSPESATGPRWPDLPIGWRSEPFQFGPLLRVARLGLARQSSGFLRRLEQQRDVRASISRTGIRTTVPQMPAPTLFGRALLVLIASEYCLAIRFASYCISISH